MLTELALKYSVIWLGGSSGLLFPVALGARAGWWDGLPAFWAFAILLTPPIGLFVLVAAVRGTLSVVALVSLDARHGPGCGGVDSESSAKRR